MNHACKSTHMHAIVDIHESFIIKTPCMQTLKSCMQYQSHALQACLHGSTVTGLQPFKTSQSQLQQRRLPHNPTHLTPAATCTPDLVVSHASTPSSHTIAHSQSAPRIPQLIICTLNTHLNQLTLNPYVRLGADISSLICAAHPLAGKPSPHTLCTTDSSVPEWWSICTSW